MGKPQRAFNRLLAQVQALREELPIWRAAMERYEQRIAGEIGPLEHELLRHLCDAVHWLDALLASTAKADRLSRRRRETLKQMLVDIAGAVLAQIDDQDIEAAFDRHSDVARQDLKDMEMEVTAAMLEEVFGAQMASAHAAASADELIEQVSIRLQAQLQAEALQRQARSAARRARRGGPTRAEAAAERRAQAEQDASRSVRDVFRRLVASFASRSRARPGATCLQERHDATGQSSRRAR